MEEMTNLLEELTPKPVVIPRKRRFLRLRDLSEGESGYVRHTDLLLTKKGYGHIRYDAEILFYGQVSRELPSGQPILLVKVVRGGASVVVYRSEKSRWLFVSLPSQMNLDTLQGLYVVSDEERTDSPPDLDPEVPKTP